MCPVVLQAISAFAQARLFESFCYKLVLETAWKSSDYLTAAVHCAIHGRDRRIIDHLHIAMEMWIFDNLPASVSIHRDDPAVAKVEHIAPI